MLNLDQLSLEERFACAFLATYLYVLEDDQNLLTKISKEVSFHADEANTDDGLKRCLKEYFLKNTNLTCQDNFTFTLDIDKFLHIFDFNQLSTISIKNVITIFLFFILYSPFSFFIFNNIISKSFLEQIYKNGLKIISFLSKHNLPITH